MLLALNKPYGTVCQFSGAGPSATLARWIDVPRVYPAGRLDADSEGLVLLTDDGALQHAIAAPRLRLAKRYWVQVEGAPGPDDLARLLAGVRLSQYVSRPDAARAIDEPAALWPREPPIRVRRSIPTRWLEIVLTEGKNRQIRHTTAAWGFPTLRLVRFAIGALSLAELGLAPGQWCAVDAAALGLKESRAQAGASQAPRQPKGRAPR